MDAVAERSRVKWLCRRGMRELDLVLTTYLERRYDTAEVAERAAFRRLLECPDPELLYFFTGRLPPPDRELADLVATIRALSTARD